MTPAPAFELKLLCAVPSQSAHFRQLEESGRGLVLATHGWATRTGQKI